MDQRYGILVYGSGFPDVGNKMAIYTIESLDRADEG